MNRELKNITKDRIKRKFFLKQEIKLVILKSIFQNRYIPSVKRFYIQTFVADVEKKYFISKQNKKCLLSGQSKSVYNKFGVGRHMIKNLNTMGLIQNLTTKK